MEFLFKLLIALSLLAAVGFAYLTGDILRGTIDGFALLGFGWLVLVLMDFINDELRRYYTGK